ncbi:unnamed protein product [Dibothriocephalus latus]|uniref:Prolyl 4-hydroxylase alpha subunit domain-containing protein n=1 Tax=Dibothriocephalus latus TaxID=60516 RepID=A0A3P7NLH1_DIBLA|nr:unnamed protein product [Dibothriocephalus latus]
MLDVANKRFDDLPNKDKIIKRIQDMPFLAKTVRERTIITATHVEETQVNDINAASFFSLALDESTDVRHLEQFSVIARYAAGDTLHEESLAVLPIKGSTKDGVKIVHQPFAFAALPNFLAPADNSQDNSSATASLIDALEAEARKLPLHRRQNDLFSLNQSDDLKSLTQKGHETRTAKFPLLCQLREFFATEFLTWMKDVTGAELDEHEVDSSVSRYEPNDYLLCHDDELERRRIAFVIYLVPEDWDSTTDGGCLDLIDSGPAPNKCDQADLKSKPGDYHPWRPVISLPPARNCLVFFEVAEIIGSRDRLSVHGWLKSAPLPRPPRSPDPLNIPRLPACFVEEDLVYRWINPLYLDVEQQQLIRRRFRSTSEIRLPGFLIVSVCT